ncbi:MAG: YigZ family protein [Clostridiales bacterium]|nr:YigZ family protein [Clostridiales bacterium]
MLREYITVNEESVCEIIVKKSRFIATIKKVKTVSQATNVIKKIREIYKDATHNTYAYIVNDGSVYQKYSDDGEPKGTAGIPIVAILSHHKLENVVVVVTRYFGGTKLGVGGLTRAYSKATTNVLEQVTIVKISKCVKVALSCSYQLVGKIQNSLKENNININNSQFLEKVTFFITVKASKANQIEKELIDLTSNHCEFKIIEEVYIEME